MSSALMDPVFGRGICEETDWSLRSKELGYRITLSPSSFAYHRGQGSTGDTDILPAGQYDRRRRTSASSICAIRCFGPRLRPFVHLRSEISFGTRHTGGS